MRIASLERLSGPGPRKNSPCLHRAGEGKAEGRRRAGSARQAVGCSAKRERTGRPIPPARQVRHRSREGVRTVLPDIFGVFMGMITFTKRRGVSVPFSLSDYNPLNVFSLHGAMRPEPLPGAPGGRRLGKAALKSSAPPVSKLRRAAHGRPHAGVVRAFHSSTRIFPGILRNRTQAPCPRCRPRELLRSRILPLRRR